MLLILALLAATAADPLSSLASERDDFAGVTWYQAPKASGAPDPQHISVYFGKFDTSGIGPLRLLIFYSGDQWVFATTAIFLVDGTKYVVHSRQADPHGCDWKHDNSRYGVYESCDIAISDADRALTTALATASVVKIRLDGERVYDWTPTARQLEDIRKVYSAWTSARGAKPSSDAGAH